MLPLKGFFVFRLLILRNVDARRPGVSTGLFRGTFFVSAATHGVFAPALVLGPLVGQLPDLARLLHVPEGREGLDQDLSLHLAFVLLARGVTEGKVEEHATRGSHRAADAECTGEDNRGDAGFFKGSGDQSDRLMADGSDRHQQCDVGALIPHLFDDLRSEFFLDASRGIDPTHEGDRIRRKAPQSLFGNQAT